MEKFVVTNAGGSFMRTAPGLHGEGLEKKGGTRAWLPFGTVIECTEEINDGYRQIVGPAELIDPITKFYKDYGKEAWIENAHLTPFGEEPRDKLHHLDLTETAPGVWQVREI